MSQFTEKGKEAAKTACIMTVHGRHEIDRTMERLGTFACTACGAIAPDSVWCDWADEGQPVTAKTYEVDCPGCEGTGFSKKIRQTCRVCKGTGKVKATI